MKCYYILLLLGILGLISGEEHGRVKRQNAVSPLRPQPGCPPDDCPADCGVQFFNDPQTGCRSCRCDPNDNSNPFVLPVRPVVARPTPGLVCNPNPPCPQDCATMTTNDPLTGCRLCTCRLSIPRPSTNEVCNLNPPCPADCATMFVRDPQTGCRTCRCRPTIGRPFPASATLCNRNPPCPADCATQFVRDPQTGCQTCQCRPTIGRPFPASATLCNRNPPCPADCAIQFVRDPQTGCQSCTCQQTSITQVGTGQSRCRPGASWTDQCNSCFCPPNGVPACTTKDCTNGVGGNVGITGCTPGATWTQNCNSCFCTANGSPACTLKGCDVCLPVQCSAGCTKETNPTTGCPTCNCQPPPDRCNPNPPCPADCAKELVRDAQNGCITCRCKTDTTQTNPFAPGCPPPRCPADCAPEVIRDPRTGCDICRCNTNFNFANPFANPFAG